MAIAVSVDQIKDFILEEDQKSPKEEQTVFKLRPLTARQRALVQDCSELASDGVSIKMHVGTIQLKTVEAGLVSWSNFKDAAGVEVKFGKNAMKNMDRLPVQVITQLYAAITDLNTVGAEEEKN